MALLTSGVAVADHKEARQLKEAGSILPLESIIERAQQQHAGRVIEVEFERKQDRYIYEVEILDDNGMVWEMLYDAGDGELLKIEQEGD